MANVKTDVSNYVDIDTINKTVKVVCPADAHCLDKIRSTAFDSLKAIHTDFENIRNSYISLGYHLSQFDIRGYYYDFGYSDIYSFAEANFNLCKSAVSRCISVFVKFALVDVNGKYVPEIDDKYKAFSYSQLSEMLPLDVNNLSLITPDMTVKQIREFKKSLSNKVSDDVAVDDVADSESGVDVASDDVAESESGNVKPLDFRDCPAPEDDAFILYVWDHMRNLFDSCSRVYSVDSTSSCKGKRFQSHYNGKIYTFNFSVTEDK